MSLFKWKRHGMTIFDLFICVFPIYYDIVLIYSVSIFDQSLFIYICCRACQALLPSSMVFAPGPMDCPGAANVMEHKVTRMMPLLTDNKLSQPCQDALMSSMCLSVYYPCAEVCCIGVFFFYSYHVFWCVITWLFDCWLRVSSSVYLLFSFCLMDSSTHPSIYPSTHLSIYLHVLSYVSLLMYVYIIFLAVHFSLCMMLLYHPHTLNH